MPAHLEEPHKECKNAPSCAFIGNESSVTEHQSNCEFRKYACIVSQCSHTPTVGGFLKHLRGDHEQEPVASDSLQIADQLRAFLEDNEDNFAHMAGLLTHEGETYALMIRKKENIVHFWAFVLNRVANSVHSSKIVPPSRNKAMWMDVKIFHLGQTIEQISLDKDVDSIPIKLLRKLCFPAASWKIINEDSEQRAKKRMKLALAAFMGKLIALTLFYVFSSAPEVPNHPVAATPCPNLPFHQAFNVCVFGYEATNDETCWLWTLSWGRFGFLAKRMSELVVGLLTAWAWFKCGSLKPKWGKRQVLGIAAAWHSVLFLIDCIIASE